jgi:hypothetical protein
VTHDSFRGFTVSTFPSRSRVSLKEAFAVLEPCAGKLACTVPRGLGPSNGAWLLGTGLAPLDFIKMVSPTSLLVPPIPRFS